MHIRKATIGDISFGELQVFKVARELSAPKTPDKILAYYDDIAKVLIHTEGSEIKTLQE